MSIQKYREKWLKGKLLNCGTKSILKLKLGNSISEEALQLKELHEEISYYRSLGGKVYKHQRQKFIQFIKTHFRVEMLESFDEQVSKTVQQFIYGTYPANNRQINS